MQSNNHNITIATLNSRGLKKEIRSAFAQFLQKTHHDPLKDTATFCSPQEQWDWLKMEIQGFIKSFQIAEVNTWRERLRECQKKRNLVLPRWKKCDERCPQLPDLEAEISTLPSDPWAADCIILSKESLGEGTIYNL
jgi:hypothetical protein